MRFVRTRVARSFCALLVLLSGACGSSHHAVRAAELVSIVEPPWSLPQITPTQLAAHLGGGLPHGWTPVDYGDARVWAPPDWAVVFGNCEQRAAGFIETDVSHDHSCQRASPLVTFDALTTLTIHAPPVEKINGYQLFAVATDRYAIPDLHVMMTARGSTSQRVLATLGPSSRAVALHYRAAPIANSRAVTHAGVIVTVPARWHVIDISGKPIACPDSRLNATVLVGNGTGGPPGCAADVSFVTPPEGSVQIGDSGPLTSVTTIRNPAWFFAPWATLVLELSVRVDQHHVVPIQTGLGRDGRVAASIIASIRALKPSPRLRART